jgi:hypothetical protein
MTTECSPPKDSSHCREHAHRWSELVQRPRAESQVTNTRESFTMRHEHKHSFITGNVVRLSKRVPPRNAALGPYKVIAQLPEQEGQFQYRVKSAVEPFYRTVTESELESDDGATVTSRRLPRTAARRRHAAHDPLRHRHDEMHLLRLLPGGLPGRRHRPRTELRVRDRDTRGTYDNKERLLANGDRWERAIAKNISLDAPYR